MSCYFQDWGELRPWQTRTHCWRHIVANTNVSPFAHACNICCGHKMFLNKIRNNFCPQQMLRMRANGETFVLATMCLQQCVLVYQGLMPMMFLGLRKVGNICCGNKLFLTKSETFFVSRTFVSATNVARGQTGKHLCRQQCVRNNVSPFAGPLECRW